MSSTSSDVILCFLEVEGGAESASAMAGTSSASSRFRFDFLKVVEGVDEAAGSWGTSFPFPFPLLEDVAAVGVSSSAGGVTRCCDRRGGSSRAPLLDELNAAVVSSAESIGARVDGLSRGPERGLRAGC